MERWNAKIRVGRMPFLYGRNWRKVNKKAGIEL